MSAVPQFTSCKCGHPHAAHPSELEESCAVPNCMCSEYIPHTLRPIEMTPVLVAAAPTNPTRPASTEELGANVPEIERILAAGRRSATKRTASLANKIDGILLDLAGRIQAESTQAKALREIAELEARLAAKRAELRGESRTAPMPRESSGPNECPDCPSSFPTRQGLGAHRAHKHGYRRATS